MPIARYWKPKNPLSPKEKKVYIALIFGGAIGFFFRDAWFRFVPLDYSIYLIPVGIGAGIAWLCLKNYNAIFQKEYDPSPLAISAFLSLLATLLTMTLYVNGQLDASPPSVHTPLVLAIKSGSRGARYLILESWREGHQTESIQWRGGDLQTVIPGKTKFKVTTKRGWLGWEWVVGYEEEVL